MPVEVSPINASSSRNGQLDATYSLDRISTKAKEAYVPSRENLASTWHLVGLQLGGSTDNFEGVGIG